MSARPAPFEETCLILEGTVRAAGLVRTLAAELAPVRVNAVHPGVVGDTPYWVGSPLDAMVVRTATGRLVTMADVVDSVDFLLRNRSVNGVNLGVDEVHRLRR